MSIKFRLSVLIELMITVIIMLTLTSILYNNYINIYAKSKNIMQEINTINTEELLEGLLANSSISENLIKNNLDYEIDLSNNKINSTKIDINQCNFDSTNPLDIIVKSINIYNKELEKSNNSIKIENIDINKVNQEIEQYLEDEFTVNTEGIDKIFNELNNCIINIKITDNNTIDVDIDIK